MLERGEGGLDVLKAHLQPQQQVTARPPARMVLAGLPGHLRRHLAGAGLAGQFTLADSTAAAVTALTSPG